MIKISIIIALGIVVPLSLCCLCWAVWKLRHRMRKGQICAAPEIPVEKRDGSKKDAAHAFPILKTSDLKVDGGTKSQHCIDPVLDKHKEHLTKGFKTSEKLDGGNPHLQQTPLKTNDPKSTSRPNSPSWILVNPPVPLPQNAMVNSSSSSETFEIDLYPSDSLGSAGESPLLISPNSSHIEDWSHIDLEKSIDRSFTFGTTDIPVEERQRRSQSSASDRDLDSFSFNILSRFAGLDRGQERLH